MLKRIYSYDPDMSRQKYKKMLISIYERKRFSIYGKFLYGFG